MRRGDVRGVLLVALLDGPAHGYELIQRLDDRSGGRWRPSPGSVYPLLQMLADEGAVTVVEQDGKRVHELTEAGRLEAEALAARVDQPWDAFARGSHAALRTAARDLRRVVEEVAQAGTPEVVERATQIVTTARKELYALLASS